jgi:aryl-alcohol dehydrogenase-like predicted oxidoreductase
MNFIDTSPFYGRGMSEVLLGIALKQHQRQDYLLGTKLGRYSLAHFDFSAKRVEESVHVSLHRLGTDYLDVLLLHDVEFVKLPQIWEETIPAVIDLKKRGLVRAIGFSCYPIKTFNTVLNHVEDDIDCVLSYNQYTLQNTRFADELVPRLKPKGIGAIAPHPVVHPEGALPRAGAHRRHHTRARACGPPRPLSAVPFVGRSSFTRSSFA